LKKTKMKRILLIFCIFLVGCTSDFGECQSFYDCLPSDVHPGETGCGGCYPDGLGELCYELDRVKCDEYMARYACVEGVCKNSEYDNGITWEENMEMKCSWRPYFIGRFPGCENVTCPSNECDDHCGKGVKVYFDQESGECKELDFETACDCPPYVSIEECERFCKNSENDWENDDIVLMRHSVEGFYGCFGCKEEGKAGLCLDPVAEMELVDETPERYCDGFNVVKIGPCEYHTDCTVPMDYAIRSNCPFGAACIDSECRVVCPLMYHDPDPEVSMSYPYECSSDSDCDCSERVHSLECLCVDSVCVSVEE
jgi:hypothetical protein